MSFRGGLIIGIAILIIGMMIGGFIANSIVFGSIMIAGIYVCFRTMPNVERWLAKRSKTFDMFLMIASVVAVAMLGLTMTASLTVAALLYSLVYAPYLREKYRHELKVKSRPTVLRRSRDRYDFR